MKRIALISTGGTIEKTYDDLSGVLANKVSVLDVMLASLELRGVAIHRVALMNKDSLEMSAEDHTLIAEQAVRLAREWDGVVVVHGTDRLALSGERIVEVAGVPASSTIRSPVNCRRSVPWTTITPSNSFAARIALSAISV